MCAEPPACVFLRQPKLPTRGCTGQSEMAPAPACQGAVSAAPRGTGAPCRLSTPLDSPDTKAGACVVTAWLCGMWMSSQTSPRMAPCGKVGGGQGASLASPLKALQSLAVPRSVAGNHGCSDTSLRVTVPAWSEELPWRLRAEGWGPTCSPGCGPTFPTAHQASVSPRVAGPSRLPRDPHCSPGPRQSSACVFSGGSSTVGFGLVALLTCIIHLPGAGRRGLETELPSRGHTEGKCPASGDELRPAWVIDARGSASLGAWGPTDTAGAVRGGSFRILHWPLLGSSSL